MKHILKLSLLLPALLLAGCAYNPKVTVYGATGTPYIAPDLCAALLQCENSTEVGCYYNSSVVTSADGRSTMVESCKAAK